MDARTTGVLLGMIAGDAYVNVRNRLQSGKYPYVSSEMRVLHGMQQRAYCEFKCQLLNQLLWRNSAVKIVKNGPEKKYEAAHFSISHPYFKLMKSWTYPNGKKTFERFWLDHLTPEGIAFWYMDDGHARRNLSVNGRTTSIQTDIATYCSEQEAAVICEWFWDKYRIRFKPGKEKGLFVIRANSENSRDFARLVQPYIIEPMMYKLHHVADLNSHECRAPLGRCEACGASIFHSVNAKICLACRSRKYYEAVLRKKRVMI